MSTHRRDSFRTFLHSRRTAVTTGSLALAAALGLPSRSGAAAEDVAAGTVVVGRDAVRGYFVEFIGAFSDATAEIPTTSATESQTSMGWVFGRRCTGELPGFPPGTGQAVRLHGCSLVEFSENPNQRTVDFYDVYDVYGVLVQLGVVRLTPGATPAG